MHRAGITRLQRCSPGALGAMAEAVKASIIVWFRKDVERSDPGVEVPLRCVDRIHFRVLGTEAAGMGRMRPTVELAQRRGDRKRGVAGGVRWLGTYQTPLIAEEHP